MLLPVQLPICLLVSMLSASVSVRLYPHHATKTALVTTSDILFLNPATCELHLTLSLWIDHFLFETLSLIFMTSSPGCFLLVFSGSFLPFVLECFTGESLDLFCVHSVTSSHTFLCAGDTDVYISSLSLSLPIRPFYPDALFVSPLGCLVSISNFYISRTRLVIFISSTIFPPGS